MMETTNLTIIVRQERRAPHQVLIAFPGAPAIPGNVMAWSAVYGGECPPHHYNHGEVSWDYIHSRTRICRDPAVYQPYLDFYAKWYAAEDETITFTIRERITHEEKRRAWGERR